MTDYLDDNSTWYVVFYDTCFHRKAHTKQIFRNKESAMKVVDFYKRNRPHFSNLVIREVEVRK